MRPRALASARPDPVAPGAPQRHSSFGLRETTISAYRSRSKWSLPTAARLRIGEVSETTIKRRAASSPAQDPVPSLQRRSKAESADSREGVENRVVAVPQEAQLGLESAARAGTAPAPVLPSTPPRSIWLTGEAHLAV